MPSPPSAPPTRAPARDPAATPAPLPLPRYPWRTRLAVPLGVAIALIAIAVGSARTWLLPATPVAVVPVVLRAAHEASQATANPNAAPTAATLQAAGWIEPDPYAIGIAALTEGTVRELLILEGQQVQAGEVVARLADEEARLTLTQAEAERALRLAERQAAQRRLDHPIDRERDLATATAQLAQTRAERAQLEHAIAAEQARADDLADQLRRLSELATTAAASQQEQRTTRFQLDAQRATLAARQAQQAVLDAQHQRHTAELKAAMEHRALRLEERRELETAQAALQLAEARLAEAQLQLERTDVRAPAAGVVMSLQVAPGMRLSRGSDDPAAMQVARLYDPQRLQVRVDVPLAEVEKVALGQPVEVRIEPMPDRVLRGEVTRVVHQADLAKNTLQFKVRLLESAPTLKPEMLARVRFLSRPASATEAGEPAATSAHLPFIPEALVRHEDAATFVFVLDRARERVRKQQITLGTTRHAGWIAVRHGLAAGDALIALTPDTPPLREGQRVRVLGEAHE